MRMALSWRDSVYEWLSKTTEESQPQRTQNDSATADSARPLDPLASLEDPRATCREHGSILGKRTRDSLNENQKDVLEQHSSKRTQNEYERRPRRKTREDRYEYKPSGSREKPKLPKDKKRRARPGRKQTMNDGFHASNVARERLTLRQNANLGIFNKGKASSPIKIRDAPDLAFSERHFLSRKTSFDHKTSVAIAVDERRNQRKKESQPCDIRKGLAAKLATPSHTVVGYTSEYIQDKVANRQCSLRYSDVSNLDQDRGPDGAHGTTQALENRIRASTQEYRSATSYSWSESEPRKSSLEGAVERRLLNILHAGLSSEENTNAIDMTDLDKDYCDLHELKSLLELRKAHWDPADSHPDHTPEQSGHCGHLSQIAKATAEGERSIGSLHALNPANLPSNCSNLLQRQTRDNASHRSRYFHDGGGTVPIHTPYEGQQSDPLHAGLEMKAEEMEADEDFFRKLDEAFHEIMNPGSKELEPTKEGTEAHLSTFQSGLNTNTGDKPYRSWSRRDSSRYGHLATLLYDQLGLDIPHMSPTPMDCRIMEEEFAAEPEGSCNLFDLSLQETQGTNDTRSTRPRELLLSTTTDADFRRLPSGFWRPNRLY